MTEAGEGSIGSAGGPNRLSVVVLSCGDLGAEVANALRRVPEVRSVTLVSAPYKTRTLGLRRKLAHVYRMEGPVALLRAIAGKLVRPFGRSAPPPPVTAPGEGLEPGIRHLHFADFHADECVAALRSLVADLGVVAGTYILKPQVFDAPLLGSINLHSGKAPEYRGSAPAFWELYNGEESVGITIHRVASALDAGTILAQEAFPLNSAPEEEALEYIDHYRRTVLRPNGVRMLVQTVSALARGEAQEWEQDHAKARNYRNPDYKAVRELRRRVRERRRRLARASS